MEITNSYNVVLSYREYLALGMIYLFSFVLFLFFSPNHNFLKFFTKKSQNFEFLQEIHNFCSTLSKIQKRKTKTKQNEKVRVGEKTNCKQNKTNSYMA